MTRKASLYSRRSRTRDIRKKLLIVTEGKTEKEYFDEYKRLPQLTVITHDAKDNKRSLVEKAIEYRDVLIKEGKLDVEDRTWAVFDRDMDKKNPHDTDNFNQAFEIARNNGINVAYSNDAVELWFLIHYQDVSSAIHRDDLNKKLAGHLGASYKKAQGRKMYDLIKDKRQDALRRARKMFADMEGVSPCDANPCTTVHLLIDEIMANGFREKK